MKGIIDFIYPFMLLLTGCGCFLVGICMMSRGFVKAGENKQSTLLKLFKSNSNAGGIVGGAVHSAITQSSSATSVLALQLLNIGAITILQTARAIIGANIGTTLTGFIVSLSETDFSEIFAFFVFIGAIPLLSSKKKANIAGEIIGGFGLLFVGINLINLYIKDPVICESIQYLFSITNNGVILVILGMLVTCLFQSSSVASSIIIFMVAGGLLPLTNAFYLIMGANIGACITSILAARGASKLVKRAAGINVMFNIVGTVIFSLILVYWKDGVNYYTNTLQMSSGLKVALFHFMFNTITAIVVCPFIKPMVKLTKFLYKG